MQPLSDLLVISIEQAVAAPACTVRLADAGARVIKIERAEGETARHYDRAVHGTSAYFAWLNRGKESAVLDIKAEKDRALLECMIAKADVFVQNLAPGAAARLDLGSRELTGRYPRLIAVDIVGYPQDSAYKAMRAYDLLIQAESGLCSVTGTPESPVKVGVSIADVLTGMNAHAAILEALIERGQTGCGKAIEIDMFGALADMMSVPLLHHEHAGKRTPRTGLNHASIFPYGRVTCRDGEIVIVVQNPGEWQRFCSDVLRRPELIEDPRFADNPRRVEHRNALQAILSDVFIALTVDEARQRLDDSGLAWSNVSTVDDLAHHPALRRVSVQTGGHEVQIPASPVRTVPSGRAVPSLGEHTDMLRKEFGPQARD